MMVSFRERIEQSTYLAQLKNYERVKRLAKASLYFAEINEDNKFTAVHSALHYLSRVPELSVVVGLYAGLLQGRDQNLFHEAYIYAEEKVQELSNLIYKLNEQEVNIIE